MEQWCVIRGAVLSDIIHIFLPLGVLKVLILFDLHLENLFFEPVGLIACSRSFSNLSLYSRFRIFIEYFLKYRMFHLKIVGTCFGLIQRH